MIYVTMKDGRTIRYNNAGAFIVNGNKIELDVGANKKSGHVATLFVADVERVEFNKPCAIHDKNGKQIKVKY